MQDFDAFGTLKALRNMKKDLEMKKVIGKNSANIKESLQFIQKKQPLSQQDLRSQFLTILSKLIDVNTKDSALKECKKLVTTTLAQNSLQTLLSCLSVPQMIYINDGILKVIQIIIECYSTNTTLQDLYKLLEMVMKHFKETALVVQVACCDVWAKTYDTFASKLSLQQKNLVLFQTLAGIISGGTNRQEQETAIACLHKLYEIANEHQDNQFIKDTIKNFVSIFLRSQIEHPSLYFCIEQILQVNKIQQFHNQQMQIVDKCLDTLSDIKCNYRVRVAAANVLKIVGIQYQNNQFNIIGGYHEQVIQILSEQTKDRLIAVQNSARVALNQWVKVKIQMDACNQKKQERISDQDKDFDNIVSNQFHNDKQVQFEDQTLDAIPHSQQFYQKDNKQYKKKQTGIGGGKVDLMRANEKRQTEHESNKQIRNLIYNKSPENGMQGQDKYSAVQQMHNDLDNEMIYQEVFIEEKRSRKLSPKPQSKQTAQVKNLPRETYLDFERQEEPHEQPQNIWEQVLQLNKDGDKQGAIQLLLDEGDDIYLIRLLMMQDDLTLVFNHLDVQTYMSLIQRVTLVLESDFFNRLCLEFLQGFNEAGVGDMVKDQKFLQFLGYMANQKDISGQQSKEILTQLSE